MDVEALIKELLDEIEGIDWQPGTMFQSLAGFAEKPVGCWHVDAGSGGSTSTRPGALIATRITITLWAATPEARAATAETIRTAFLAVGFALAPSQQSEAGLPGELTAYICTLTMDKSVSMALGGIEARFKGLMDKLDSQAERLAKVEEKAASAHKRIDEIKGGHEG